MGKYAGYAIERGKLEHGGGLYKIGARRQAEAQPPSSTSSPGDKVESPDATALPVLLAVALLKDRNGVIDINLPISGSDQRPAVQRLSAS